MHKRVYSIFTHWLDQDLLLRPNKIKKYWSLPLTDSSILWHFCKWTINTGEIFLSTSCFLRYRNQSCSNNKLIYFSLSPSNLPKDDKNRCLRRTFGKTSVWKYKHLLTASQFKFFYQAILQDQKVLTDQAK